MNFGKEDLAAVRELVASKIVEELRAELGGSFEEFAVLPVSFVGPLVGLSAKQAGRVLPVVSFGPRSNGVSIKALRAHLGNHTKTPKSKP